MKEVFQNKVFENTLSNKGGVAMFFYNIKTSHLKSMMFIERNWREQRVKMFNRNLA